jgi:aryl-alcohol dehydrogenase-like predicted oxidoreductase
MQTRTIGNVEVSAIGLGGMQLSIGGGVPDERAIATIHAALDAGITLIDSADAYYTPGEHDVGHNERIIARALEAWNVDTSHVLVATKGGHTRSADGGWDIDASPEHLRQACDASLAALGVERIGLYQLHRPDPAVDYAESIGALAELREVGKVAMVGVSNASIDQIRIAQEVLGSGGLASVQNEFSPGFRSSDEEVKHCETEGIAFLPWSPFGGVGEAAELGQRNAAFAELAEERGVSPQQVVLAWMLARSPVIVPIPGSSRPETARSSAAAADLELTTDEVARLDATG